MRQQPESRKSERGPLDLKDYLRIWRRPQTCLLPPLRRPVYGSTHRNWSVHRLEGILIKHAALS